MASLTNRGLIKTAVGKVSVSPIPIPRVRDGYILVKTVAVAVNPTDWQTVDESNPPGQVPMLLGCDVSGVVVEVGNGVTKEWKKGDRVLGMAHGANEVEPEDGTFAEYIVLKGDIALRISEHVRFEAAATFGAQFATMAVSLYSPTALGFPFLEIPLEKRHEEEKFIFIYGGSTAMGTMAIQFAKLSGFTVVTATSLRNSDLVKGYGADHIFDYRDANVGQAIRELTHNSLHRVLDTISVASSAQICADALASSSTTEPLLYVNLSYRQNPRPDVKSIFPLGYTVMGERVVIEDGVWPASPEDYELAKGFTTTFEGLLQAKLIKNHPVDLREGGLEGILGGMQDLKDGKVSGAKLVYRVGEANQICSRVVPVGAVPLIDCQFAISKLKRSVL